MISVFSSSITPSAVSKTICGISLASSMMKTNRLPLLCKPANAAGFCSLQGTKSKRQVSLCFSSTDLIEVMDLSNQLVLIALRNQIANSGDVLVSSCFAVFAVIFILQSLNVLIDHQQIIEMSADFPMSCPLLIATWQG